MDTQVTILMLDFSLTVSNGHILSFTLLPGLFRSAEHADIHSQCVTSIEISQAISSWSNVGRLRFEQHLVK